MSPIARLPRLTRIIMVMGFAIALTFLLMPLVDRVYLTQFFDPATTMLPALISSGAGLVMYLLGWWLLVGEAGGAPRMRRATLLYLLAGVAIVVALLVLFVIGVIDGVRLR
jgi:hypothetical protein